jgi:hypothetical protein
VSLTVRASCVVYGRNGFRCSLSDVPGDDVYSVYASGMKLRIPFLGRDKFELFVRPYVQHFGHASMHRTCEKTMGSRPGGGPGRWVCVGLLFIRSVYSVENSGRNECR